MLHGLAKTCFVLRSKSLTDLSVGPITAPTTFDGNKHEKWRPLSSGGSNKSGLDLHGARRNLRVLSYPLVATSNHPLSPISSVPPVEASSSSSSECYGVLQVVIPLAEDGRSMTVTGGRVVATSPPSSTVCKGRGDSESKKGSDRMREYGKTTGVRESGNDGGGESEWLNDNKHLDDCCVGMVRMISAATMMHRKAAVNNLRLGVLADAVQSWEVRRSDQEAVTERWKCQATSWQSVTHIIAALLGRANDCADFPTAVRQAELHPPWSSLLRVHAGVSLFVRNAVAGDRDVFPGTGTGTTTTSTAATTTVRANTHVDNHGHTHVNGHGYGHASPLSRPTQVVPLDNDGTVVVEIRYDPSSVSHPPTPTNTNNHNHSQSNNSISNRDLVHPSSVSVHPSSTMESNASAVPSTGGPAAEMVDLLCVLFQGIRTLHEEKQRLSNAVSSSSSSSSSSASSSSSMITPMRAGNTSSSASASASVYGWKPHHPGTHYPRA